MSACEYDINLLANKQIRSQAFLVILHVKEYLVVRLMTQNIFDVASSRQNQTEYNERDPKKSVKGTLQTR